MRETHEQRRGRLLMHAYLHHHASAVHRPTAWFFLLAWAELGGRTSEVPKEFGGTA